MYGTPLKRFRECSDLQESNISYAMILKLIVPL